MSSTAQTNQALTLSDGTRQTEPWKEDAVNPGPDTPNPIGSAQEAGIRFGKSSTTLAFHLLVTLTVTVVCLNLGMNIFLIRVLQLGRGGMTSVKFSPSSGIWLRDQAVFADLLRTTRLSHVNYNKVR